MKLSSLRKLIVPQVDFSIGCQRWRRWKVSSHQFWTNRDWTFHSLLFLAAQTCRMISYPLCQNQFWIRRNCQLTEIYPYQRGSLFVHICFGLCHLHQRAGFFHRNFELSDNQTFWKKAHRSWSCKLCRLLVLLFRIRDFGLC